MTPPFNPTSVIFTPPQAADYTKRYIEQMRLAAPRALGLGIEGIDGYFAPLGPGQVAGVIGQASNFKSGFLHCIENNNAMMFERSGRINEVLVHVSVEEFVEEQILGYLGRESGQNADDLARGVVSD